MAAFVAAPLRTAQKMRCNISKKEMVSFYISSSGCSVDWLLTVSPQNHVSLFNVYRKSICHLQILAHGLF
uniref:Uncharacterized protein n=1 Tax=Arundo donax TaxID=35708 RepID=A0A0A9DMD2_ARUDO